MKNNLTLFGALFSLLLFGCGKKHDDPTPTPLIGKVVQAEVSIVNSKELNIRVAGNHSYDFDTRVVNDEVIIAAHNGARVGRVLCIESLEEQCIRKLYRFNFLDRGVQFKGEVEVEESPYRLEVLYFEKNKGSEKKNNYKYASARHVKVIIGQLVSHSIIFEDYLYHKMVRDQVFIRKLHFKSDDKKGLNIIGKLPRFSTKDESLFTDMFRSGYRSKQRPDVEFVDYYKNEIIFEGIEAKDEWDRTFDDDNREVGLMIPSLLEIL